MKKLFIVAASLALMAAMTGCVQTTGSATPAEEVAKIEAAGGADEPLVLYQGTDGQIYHTEKRRWGGYGKSDGNSIPIVDGDYSHPVYEAVWDLTGRD